MESVRVNSITRLRIRCDGQGVRSVVFLQGCPLDCFWCCNPEIRAGDDCKTLTGEQLAAYLRRDVPYFLASGGGITFSGGEPFAQAEGYAELAQALQEKGYNPINQIVGYILSEDPTYITSYNNARGLIRKLDRDELMKILVNSYLRND